MADDNDAKRLLPPSAPQPTAAYIKGLRSNGGSAYANGEEVFKHTKESVLNDVTNTGVMAALIGGFALSAVQSNTTDWEADYVATIDTIIYLLTIFSVHSCTCSALTSALLYRTVNTQVESKTAQWAERNWMLLIMPMAKFAMGTVAYIFSVLLSSYRTLEADPGPQLIACSIGIMSFLTVVGTMIVLQTQDA